MATVAETIDKAKDNADKFLEKTNTAVENAKNVIINFALAPLQSAVPTDIDITVQPDLTPFKAGTVFQSADAQIPTFREDITFVEPTKPTEPESAPALDSIALGAGVPEFRDTAPVYTPPTKPLDIAPFTDQPQGINTTFDFPTPLTASELAIPPAPDLSTASLPDAPSDTDVPIFDVSRPVLAMSAPTDLAAQFSAAYESKMPSVVSAVNGYVDSLINKYNPNYTAALAALESQLTKYLNGGTGLSANVETAIYERSRTKQDAEAGRVRDGAIRDFADRGFTLPPGALTSALQQARQSAADNNAQSAREIVVMQAEMEQKNLQFAVTTSANLRAAMLSSAVSYMSNLVQINGQAIEYGKSVMQALLSTYEIATKVYSAQLEAFRAEASVYEIRMKASLFKLEVYKAKLDGFSTLQNANVTRVNAYKAKIEAAGELVNLYKQKVEATVQKAQLERLKIDLFRTQVEAYSAKVQAKEAEWRGFETQVRGEESKVKTFATLADIYQTKAKGYEQYISTQAAVIDSKARRIASENQVYSSKVGAYSAELQAEMAKMDGNFRIEGFKATAYNARLQLAEAASREAIEAHADAWRLETEKKRLQNEAFKIKYDSIIGAGNVLRGMLDLSVNANSRITSSSLTGLNAIVSETTTS